jgi:hypothetical protein
LRSDPRTFYITDHYRDWSWVLVRLASVSEAQLGGPVESARRRAAPKSLTSKSLTSSKGRA